MDNNTTTKILYIDKDKADEMNALLRGDKDAVKRYADRHGHPVFDGEVPFLTRSGVTYRAVFQVIPPYDEDGNAWTQGVLYDSHGREITFTEPDDEILGEWQFYVGAETFITLIRVKQ